MTDTVWLSTAPQRTHISSKFTMEDRVVPAQERSRNMMFHWGGGHSTRTCCRSARSNRSATR